jgi:hypothetical protein
MKIKKDLAIGLLAGLAIALIAFSWWYYAQLPPGAKPSDGNATSTKPQVKNEAPPTGASPKVATPLPLPVVDTIDSMLVNILAINGSKSRVEKWSGAACLKSKDIKGVKFTTKSKFNFDSYLRNKGFAPDNQCAADGTIGGLAGYIRKSDGAYCSVEWLKNDVINGIEFKIACEYAI